MDHAAITLSYIAVSRDGGGLIEVRLSVIVSIPVERVALIIRA